MGQAPEKTGPAGPGGPRADPYLGELLARAAALHLWEQKLWHRLLHYLPDTFGSGVTSEADGAGFFNAPDGKTNPRAELEATLAGFFSGRVLPPGRMTTRCTFPARFEWLRKRLDLDAARLPPQPCTRWNQWRASLDPASVSLVFSSFYFNNPASMFGHTLLVLNQRGRPENLWLLNYAVNYAALVSSDTGAFAYAFNGLFGGFQGYFGVVPYYLKVREYNDTESRDLWEYRLNLTQEQVDRLVRHTWEMGATSFDYFFLKENCSYHLLALLEVANPELELRSGFNLYTLPSDTVRVLTRQPGLVSRVIYRPSRNSQLNQKLAVMTDEEIRLVARLAENADEAGGEASRALPPAREALVLEAAVDIYQSRLVGKKGDAALTVRTQRQKLLLRRAQLGAGGPPVPNAPQSTPPEDGHRTAYLRLGAGAAEGQAGFGELEFQPAFHNLLARESGYARNSHLEIGQIRLRYFPALETARVERLTLLELRSLAPLSLVAKSFSWKASGGWRRERLGGCTDCVPFFLDGGIGYAVRTKALQGEVYFAFLEAALDAHHDFAEEYRLGLGLRLGMVVTVTDWWRFLVGGVVTDYTLGQEAREERLDFQHRFVLSRNTDLGLEFVQINDAREALFSLGWYF